MNYKQFYNDLFERRGAYFHKWVTLKNRTYLEHARRINNFIDKTGIVLDLGCGDCYITNILSKKSDVLGTDISQKALKLGKSIYPNLKLLTGSAIAIPLKGNSVDFVTTSKIIEHLTPEDAETMLKEIRRVLKPGGKLVLSTSNPLNIWEKILHIYLRFKSEEEEHLKEYLTEDLRQTVNRHLSVEKIIEKADPPFFKHFPGLSAFVMFSQKLFLKIFPVFTKYFRNQLYVVAVKK